MLERVDETIDDCGLGHGFRQRHVMRVPVRGEASSGPDERAVDGRHGRAEDAGDLGRREANHIPEHEDRSLLWRQALQARHERECDRLARIVLGFGAWGGAVEQHIRERLEPASRSR